MSLILLDLLRLALEPDVWCVLENIPCAEENHGVTRGRALRMSLQGAAAQLAAVWLWSLSCAEWPLLAGVLLLSSVAGRLWQPCKLLVVNQGLLLVTWRALLIWGDLLTAITQRRPTTGSHTEDQRPEAACPLTCSALRCSHTSAARPLLTWQSPPPPPCPA